MLRAHRAPLNQKTITHKKSSITTRSDSFRGPKMGHSSSEVFSNTMVGVDSSLVSGASARPIYQRRFSSTSPRFNDPVSSDVILTLHFETSVDDNDVNLYLHSDLLLGKSRFFSAFLSDRWQTKEDQSTDLKAVTFNVPASMGSVDATMTIFELFYSTDDADDDFSEAINTVSSALSIINTALQLMFEDCVRACIRFLEAVPWTDEEEKRVLSLIHLLKPEESKELLDRVFLEKGDDSSADLLHGLIIEAAAANPPDEYPNNVVVAPSKAAFVSMLMKNFSSRDSARLALNQAFVTNLSVLKESLAYLSNPYYLSGRGNDLTAMTNEKHVTWLIETMIELRVGDAAVKEWIDQDFSDDLMEFFRDYERSESDTDAMRIVALVFRSTSKLAHAVVTGSIIADRQVRMKLVKDWLPVLIVSKKKVLPIFANDESTYRDLEKAFLRIISTLPMTDSQELLKQCINLEESPELLSVFITWFRRAAQPSA